MSLQIFLLFFFFLSVMHWSFARSLDPASSDRAPPEEDTVEGEAAVCPRRRWGRWECWAGEWSREVCNGGERAGCQRL